MVISISSVLEDGIAFFRGAGRALVWLCVQAGAVGARARYLRSLDLLLHIVESRLSRVEAGLEYRVRVARVLSRAHLTVVHVLCVAVIEQVPSVGRRSFIGCCVECLVPERGAHRLTCAVG